MMCHPFLHGVVIPGPETGNGATEMSLASALSRRSFVGRCAAALSGALAIVFGRTSLAQQFERGSGGNSNRGNSPVQQFGRDSSGRHGGGVTTQAVGEEGGWSFRPPGGVTTYALGEEGSGYYPPRYNYPPRYHYPPRYTYPPRQVTTYALGEEGGYYDYPPRRDVTTYALGEEGGGYYFYQR